MSMTEVRELVRLAPELSEYERNRLKIPDAEWERFDQQWVALSVDGQSVLAGAPDLVQLKSNLQVAGIDIADIGVEFVDFRDELVGGQAEVA